MTRVVAGMTRVVAGVAASTPPGRDRVIDAVRSLSLVVVVAGHWLMAGLAVTADGQVQVVNTLTVVPELRPLTWVLQVMPLFFVAGGLANMRVWVRLRASGGGYVEYLRGRLVRLLAPVVVFVVTTQAILVAAWAAGTPAEDLAYVARLLGRPLWFLVVYVVVTAVAPVMIAGHRRRPWTTLLVPVGLAATIDVARVATGSDLLSELAVVNFVLVWLVAQQVGFWYADGRWPARRTGAAWVVAGAALVALVGLTVAGPYSVSMIGLPGEMSNMNPPSVCLLVLTAGQAALIMALRPRLNRWLARPWAWAVVVAVGVRAIHLYLWHLPALVVLVVVMVVGGGTLPEVGGALWWATRPVWLVVLAAMLAGLVVAAVRVQRWWPGRFSQGGAGRASTVRVAAGAVLLVGALVGFATGGLEPFGPAGEWLFGVPAWLIPSTGCLVAGWVMATAGLGQRYQSPSMYQSPSTLRRSKE
ncbi:acyltransferase family protein [Phytoactinopolyspora limicola]|uniref:acyltransferase family protein n=1 Tax=Phytoactinopolyspora limicola TaxID=2715536 RepID=UPI00140DDFF8|nr:acyltransferase family protein [Phytoactinopolyspora limicola]